MVNVDKRITLAGRPGATIDATGDVDVDVQRALLASRAAPHRASRLVANPPTMNSHA
jgi:hypothetical protein